LAEDTHDRVLNTDDAAFLFVVDLKPKGGALAAGYLVLDQHRMKGCFITESWITCANGRTVHL
jgi:hypothetical protein